MTKEYISMKFSDYIQKQGDEFRKAGDGYEALSDTSKACIDSAVQRYVDEYAAKKQAIAFDKWKWDNRWHSLENGYWYQTLEHPSAMPDKTYNKYHRKTPQELYNQFIEQQNKP